MEFRLIYSGPLKASTNNDKQARHKHEIRKKFHTQMKQLWRMSPSLAHSAGPQFILTESGPVATTEDELASKFNKFGNGFVPLVTRELSLRCDIRILFLRRDRPGALLKSGDIDNRLKTLFDALRLPQTEAEMGASSEPFQDNERPFYCLLEDDALITSVAVDTDLLLLSPTPQESENDTHLVITVRVEPLRFSPHNMHLG